ncbi:quinone oxidoreductase [bacterium]|nr:quinone oxidoreductase [bacterium]MCI0603855.1 quinone oxidoreductase [bacterium]
MKTIRIDRYGGPEMMRVWEIEIPQPKEGEVRIRMEAIGVNYIDIYHRTGLYALELPFTPGVEGAGEVDGVGPNVKEFSAGDRVAFTMHPGAYAEYAVVPAKKVIQIPHGISYMQAAAILLQGMTVHYLTHGTYYVKAHDKVLIHAAAGGVGRLLVQACKHFGAYVIATVSNEEKADIAMDAGANEVINYEKKDFLDEVKRITKNVGVSVVYDSVGKTTFERSLECLKPRGLLALFGQSSGPVPPFNVSLLARNSLFLTRPSLAHYTTTREELLERASEVFQWVQTGVLKIRMDQTFPLAQAAEAHIRLECRASTGKILLLP